MPQGKMKTKVKLPAGAKQKKSRQKKPLGPKKGGRPIAPKKAKHMEAMKIKQSIEKGIKSNIEQLMTQKAQSCEPKSFHIVSSSSHSKADQKKK